MLRSVKELKNYILNAKDGTIGKCKDFLFDDDFWTIRFMVADTGKWLPGIKVLITPIAMEQPDWSKELFPVKLTKSQVENAPNLDEAKPVSRQYESKYFKYYGWPYYWAGTYAWGAEATSAALYDAQLTEDITDENIPDEENHLRSINEVTGYHIKSLDDKFGHIEDFIIDDETWTIRYIVIDTKNWLPGKKVLISKEWIKDINWSEAEVKVDLKQEEIKNSPEYDPNMPVNKEYETRLYNFYGKPIYWKE